MSTVPLLYMSPTTFAPIGYPDSALIAKGNNPAGSIEIRPIPVMKLTHIKKGSIAGSTLDVHSVIPFLADITAISENTIINMHDTSAAIAASKYDFFVNKIPILNIILLNMGI
jgi:hypothetical protein